MKLSRYFCWNTEKGDILYINRKLQKLSATQSIHTFITLLVLFLKKKTVIKPCSQTKRPNNKATDTPPHRLLQQCCIELVQIQ